MFVRARVCLCMSAFVRVCAYLCERVHSSVHLHVRACGRACVCAWETETKGWRRCIDLRVRAHACVCSYTRAHACACVHVFLFLIQV